MTEIYILIDVNAGYNSKDLDYELDYMLSGAYSTFDAALEVWAAYMVERDVMDDKDTEDFYFTKDDKLKENVKTNAKDLLLKSGWKIAKIDFSGELKKVKNVVKPKASKNPAAKESSETDEDDEFIYDKMKKFLIGELTIGRKKAGFVPYTEKQTKKFLVKHAAELSNAADEMFQDKDIGYIYDDFFEKNQFFDEIAHLYGGFLYKYIDEDKVYEITKKPCPKKLTKKKTSTKVKILNTFEVDNCHVIFKIYKFLIDKDIIIYTNDKDFVYDRKTKYDDVAPGYWYHIYDADNSEDVNFEDVNFKDEVSKTKDQYPNVFFHHLLL